MASTTTTTPQKPFHIAVCGGGIGGLCMTIGLLHQNIPVTLYEAAPAFAEIGAGVSFGPNAVTAMGLISPLIAEGYKKISTGNGWESKRTTWFDFRAGMKLSGEDGLWGDGKGGKKWELAENEFIARAVAGEVGNNCVHRARFLDTLVALLPEGVAKFGKKVQDVQTRDDGKMTLIFGDGTRAEADAVIGCDGVKSSLRPILLGKDHEATQAVFSGRYAYRGLIPMDKAVAALGDELARNSQMYLGRHGHVLTFPIEKGTIMNVVAFRAKPDGKWENEQWVLPMKKEDMFNDYVDWGDSVKKILQLMEKPDVWALFDHPPAPTYYKHNLCIAGDAAHASTPHQGAGAGQAIEDAFVLSNLLGQVNSSSGLEQAFKAYDAIRRPRSQKNVKTSRETSAVYEFEDEEISGDLEKIRWTLENRYRWIWEEDLNEQLARAKALMTGTGEQQKASL